MTAETKYTDAKIRQFTTLDLALIARDFEMPKEAKDLAASWHAERQQAEAVRSVSDADAERIIEIVHGTSWCDYSRTKEVRAELEHFQRGSGDARCTELLAALKETRRELHACQAAIHLHGGFDPAYVIGAMAAISHADAAMSAKEGKDHD